MAGNGRPPTQTIALQILLSGATETISLGPDQDVITEKNTH